MKHLILSELSQVVKASDAFRQFGLEIQLDDSFSGQLELILVEALNNVIEHSYQGEAGHPIHIDFNQVSDEIIITIQDEGLAVPDFVKNIKTMPDEDSLPEGGWGLGLIHVLADRIEFSVKDGMNVLVLGKHVIT